MNSGARWDISWLAEPYYLARLHSSPRTWGKKSLIRVILLSFRACSLSATGANHTMIVMDVRSPAVFPTNQQKGGCPGRESPSGCSCLPWHLKGNFAEKFLVKSSERYYL